MITGDHIRAARALLDWSQQDLATRTGLNITGLGNIESGKTDPKTSTIDLIVKVFFAAGVDVTPRGVTFRDNPVTILSGTDWFNELLDDIYSTLSAGGGELLLKFADDRVSPPEVIEKYRRIRAAGIRMRQLTEHGNEYCMGPPSEYRWVPASHFQNWVTLIYADKVAVCLDADSKCSILQAADFAATARREFDLLWSLLPGPERTIADVRF